MGQPVEPEDTAEAEQELVDGGGCDMRQVGLHECQHCGRPFNPNRSGWLCTYKDCRAKNSCCT